MKSVCGTNHTPAWLITYDTGKNQIEQILVCKACFEDPDNDCFRLFVVSKDDVEREIVQLD